MQIVFMYSGQGSQYYQMGRALYEQGGVFAQTLERLDGIASEAMGVSVLAELYGARRKSDPFDDTWLTSPAIAMVELALTREVLAQGIRPDLVLGASLGTTAAAALAGCVTEHDAMALVIEQAGVLKRCCPPGAMLAVLGDPQVHASDPVLRQESALAGINFANGFVLAMPETAVPRITAVLWQHAMTFQRLPVRHAFHSEWIDAARDPLLAACATAPRSPARLPMVSCVDGHRRFSASPEYLWRVVRDPIRFDLAIATIEKEGPALYLDLGPSGTLATFLKYLLPAGSRSQAVAAMNPYGNDVEQLGQAVRAAQRVVLPA